ncbi:BET1 homolog isoform X1 [Tubulanus polymorphus]|uniref:BET1 homolog isoform X1 n=1 Tax=Tubulanus polymorphus TaxID=672921 RepID=UPI003DA32305
MRRPHSGKMGDVNNGYGSQNQLIEDENQQMEESLSHKVRALKSLTIDIGHEVRTQNKMLGEMDQDFESTGGFLQKTMGRLTGISRSGGGRIIWYMLLFALFVFFVCWIILKFR